MRLNSDMGEAFGIYDLGADEALMEHVSLANVACGFHAGDPMVMRQTVKATKAHGVGVGRHPSSPALRGLGRREMAMGRDELASAIVYQVGALKGFLDAEELPLSHI